MKEVFYVVDLSLKFGFQAFNFAPQKKMRLASAGFSPQTQEGNKFLRCLQIYIFLILCLSTEKPQLS